MNGSRNSVFRSRGKRPIDTVSFDGNGTVFTPLHERSMSALSLMVAARVLKRRIKIPEDLFEERMNRLRIDLALYGSGDKLVQGSVEYWGARNAAIFNSFGYRCRREEGCRISAIIRSDPRLYEVSAVRKAALRKITKNGFGAPGSLPVRRTLIASSSDRAMIMSITERCKVSHLFGTIVTPVDLGETEKIDLEFFPKLLEREALDPSRTVHIGNSAFKDATAAKSGIWTILVMSENNSASYPELRKLYGAEAMGRIFPARNLDEVWQVLNSRFVSVR
jgi:FMN phosphatase YigB (HAD superfamily)